MLYTCAKSGCKLTAKFSSDLCIPVGNSALEAFYIVFMEWRKSSRQLRVWLLFLHSVILHLIMQLCCLESTRDSVNKCIYDAQVLIDSFPFFLLCCLCKAEGSGKQQLILATSSCIIPECTRKAIHWGRKQHICRLHTPLSGDLLKLSLHTNLLPSSSRMGSFEIVGWRLYSVWMEIVIFSLKYAKSQNRGKLNCGCKKPWDSIYLLP